MRDDIFKRLMFGVRKTATQTKKELKYNVDLRLRVLPDGFKEEVKLLRKKVRGEDDDDNLSKDMDIKDKGIELFTGNEVSEFSKKCFKKRKLLQVEQNHISSYKKRIVEKIAHLRRINRIYTWGDNIPEPLIDFEELDLPLVLLNSLNEFGIKEPTPIQMQAIPLMHQRRDVLASAPTGSGKTLAFALPVILNVLRHKRRNKNKDCTKLLAIVLEPTRELAVQTYRQFLKFGQNLPITSAYFESEDIPKVDILVSTPNRLTHHLNDFNLKALRWLIVDESDRLFDVTEGQDRCFRNQLATIYKACNGKFTRRAFFSATFSYEVEDWCKGNLNDVAMLCIGERNSANVNVTQELVFASSEHGKLIALRTLLTQFDPPALIFVQSKERARELMTAISSFPHPVPVDYISSEKSQEERDNAIESFRSGRIWLLICTELMGRGLDFKDVNLVINFDLPTSVISYIHRVGRTGRAGRTGKAITYFTESDMEYLRPIATVISQAGFEVPQYALTLKPVNRNKKHELLRKAPKRKHIMLVKKRTPGNRSVDNMHRSSSRKRQKSCKNEKDKAMSTTLERGEKKTKKIV